MSRRPGASNASTSRQQRLMERHFAQEETARVCTNFMKHLFDCPELPPASPTSTLPLKQFIACVIRSAGYPLSLAFAALFLVERVKARLPRTLDVPCGHRLFLVAYIVASKTILDVTRSNYQWSLSAYKLFALEDINQMERDLLACLEWDLQIFHPDTLPEFEANVRRIYTGLGPYPPYVLPAALHASTPFSRPTAGAEAADSGDAPPASERTSTWSTIDLNDPAQLVLPSPLSDYMVISSRQLPTPELWSPTSATPASAAMPPTPAGHVGHSLTVTSAEKGTNVGMPVAVLAESRRPPSMMASYLASSGTAADAEVSVAKGSAPATTTDLTTTVTSLLTRVIASVL